MRQLRPTLVKFGGELLEKPLRLRRIARAIVDASKQAPIVVVHGGGREVDGDMARLGIPKRAVDGLRITDAETLDVVLGALAGQVNTRFVAAIGAAGGSGVGLTGVDAGLTPVQRSRRYRTVRGQSIDLGFVGVPNGRGSAGIIGQLTKAGHIPIVASIGADRSGRLYNVNADTMAGDLAPRIGARRLIIAGVTRGVLDANGRTIPVADAASVDDLVYGGQASAGMVAKLLACQAAHAAGVVDIAIVDGRRSGFLRTDGASGVTRVARASRSKTR